jgi:taurine dioxygenase
MTTHFSNYYNTQRVPYGGDFTRADDLLRYLTNRANYPEFQVRFRWRAGSIAVWDNMLTQHYAVHDYTARRRMVRATLKGFRPTK